MTEPKSHIPRNAEEMKRVKEGDLVLIIVGDDPEDKFKVVFDKSCSGCDFFIARGGYFGKDTVSQYAQNRTEHEYDKQNGGIILAGRSYGFNYYNLTDRSYSEKVTKLKQAGLWQESQSLAEVRA